MGLAVFLVAVAEYLKEHHKSLFRDKRLRSHFHTEMFHSSDFDSSMLRIGAMNMTLHGIDDPQIIDRDSLSEDHAEERNKYSLILANPPFKGRWIMTARPKICCSCVKLKKPNCYLSACF